MNSESYHSSSLLSQEDRISLSLLPSLNPEMSYATITLFFRDADLIPSSLQNTLSQPEHQYLNSPHIPRSLISPPPGFHCPLFLRVKTLTGSMGSKHQDIGNLLSILNQNGFIMSGMRLCRAGAGRAMNLFGSDPSIFLLPNESSDELYRWFNVSVVLAISLWKVDALSDLLKLHKAGFKRNSDTSPAKQSSISVSDIYIPKTYSLSQYQLSAVFPTGLPVDLVHSPGNFGSVRILFYPNFEKKNNNYFKNQLVFAPIVPQHCK
jgi:hypothetical protein